jgi:hypothetical protein
VVYVGAILSGVGCNGRFAPGQWALNSADASAPNFAALDTLERYRDRQAMLVFNMTWPMQVWAAPSLCHARACLHADVAEAIRAVRCSLVCARCRLHRLAAMPLRHIAPRKRRLLAVNSCVTTQQVLEGAPKFSQATQRAKQSKAKQSIPIDRAMRSRTCAVSVHSAPVSFGARQAYNLSAVAPHGLPYSCLVALHSTPDIPWYLLGTALRR